MIPPRETAELIGWAGPRTRLEVHTYPGLAHEISDEEMADVARFVKRQIQAAPTA